MTPATLKHRFAAALLVALLLAPTIGCQAHRVSTCKAFPDAAALQGEASKKQIPVSVSHPRFGVSVFSASGKRLLELAPKEEVQEDESGQVVEQTFPVVYLDSDIDHIKRTLLVSQCEQYRVRFSPFNEEHGECHLVEHSLENGSVLRKIREGVNAVIRSPVYSPDGQWIAMFEGEELLALDRESLEEHFRSRPVVLERIDPYGAGAYLRWSRDGAKLFVNIDRGVLQPIGVVLDSGQSAMQTPSPELLEIDLASGAITPVDSRWEGEADLMSPSRVRSLGGRKSLGIYRTSVPAFSDNRESIVDVAYPPENEANAILLGSREHPVFKPQWSPSGRYYFYVRIREGFLGSTTLEGYDCLRDMTFRVKTLEKSLYTK